MAAADHFKWSEVAAADHLKWSEVAAADHLKMVRGGCRRPFKNEFQKVNNI